MTSATEKLQSIDTLDALVDYLRDDMGWPIESDAKNPFEDIAFEYTPEELGIDEANAAKIESIKRMRPLTTNQPWGVFFVEFEPKKLPVTALRRILNEVVTKKRASANAADRVTWDMEDLMFVSAMGGDGGSRKMTFAHFSEGDESRLPDIKVIAWDDKDTPLAIQSVVEKLTEKLAWPDDEEDTAAWREAWSSAFTLRHREVISTSKGLAGALARLARDIRGRILDTIAIESENGPVTQMMNAFRGALINDLDPADFADMYAQTIAYGLLSARIIDADGRASTSGMRVPVTNPFLRELMEEFLLVGGEDPGQGGAGIHFDELGVNEVIDLLDEAKMDEVVRDFGDRNPDEDPVIHFYESFLAEYDPDTRMQRGVFYTPRPVVSFIVRSVHEILKDDFGLTDGLADTTTWGDMASRLDDLEIPPGVSRDQPFVRILDPATGTGTFLVEVIDVIHTTLTRRWTSEGRDPDEIVTRWNEYVPAGLLPRLVGFELLMAPYAIAHLKIGLKLLETGYRFADSQRANIYLTNALEPATGTTAQLDLVLPALAHEASSVNEIKQHDRFTVFIGNPPYSKVSMNMTKWATSFVKNAEVDGIDLPSYYEVDGEPLGERKLNLQDDYVKFIRLGQLHSTRSGAAIVAMITNRGFLASPTFRGMRQSLLSTFDSIGIIDLHGDTNVGESPPDGRSNENVFDIQQGVAVSILTRHASFGVPKRTLVDIWGTRSEKYGQLLRGSLAAQSEAINPTAPFHLFALGELDCHPDYDEWWPVHDIFTQSASGIVTSRDGFVIGFTDDEILDRMDVFLDEEKTDVEVASTLGLKENYQWRVSDARSKMRSDPSWRSRFRSILYRPFDTRRILYHPAVVWRTREPLMDAMNSPQNLGLLVTRQGLDDYSHAFVTDLMIEYKTCSHHRNTTIFPLLGSPGSLELPGLQAQNISAAFLEAIGLGDGAGAFNQEPERVLHYVYAILHSPTYRSENAKRLKIDYPRIPVARDAALRNDLVSLGARLVALHLLQSPVVEDDLPRCVGTMDSAVARPGWSDDTIWFDAGSTSAADDHHASVPGTAGVAGVPRRVWAFRIGGYQVCHKWLKSRAGKVLSADEVLDFRRIVKAVAETTRLMVEIDEVVDRHGGWSAAFESSA